MRRTIKLAALAIVILGAGLGWRARRALDPPDRADEAQRNDRAVGTTSAGRPLPRFGDEGRSSAQLEASRVIDDPAADMRDVFWAYKTEVCACADYACFAALGPRYNDKLATAAVVLGEAEYQRLVHLADAEVCVRRLNDRGSAAHEDLRLARRQAAIAGAGRDGR